MYELLTLVDEPMPHGRDGKPRPYVIVEHPSRVVFTFVKKDKELAEETLYRLNNPQFEWDDEPAFAAA